MTKTMITAATWAVTADGRDPNRLAAFVATVDSDEKATAGTWAGAYAGFSWIEAAPELVDDVEETTPIPAETCRQVVEGRLR